MVCVCVCPPPPNSFSLLLTRHAHFFLFVELFDCRSLQPFVGLFAFFLGHVFSFVGFFFYMQDFLSLCDNMFIFGSFPYLRRWCSFFFVCMTHFLLVRLSIAFVHSFFHISISCGAVSYVTSLLWCGSRILFIKLIYNSPVTPLNKMTSKNVRKQRTIAVGPSSVGT